MPDTLMVSSTVVASEAEDHALAAALVREIAAGRSPRAALDRPLPPVARPAVEALAEALDELDRDLTRLRRRRSAPPSAGGRIRLAAAEAELLGAYERDVAEALAALRGAGAAVVSARAGERNAPPCAVNGGGVVLRLIW